MNVYAEMILNVCLQRAKKAGYFYKDASLLEFSGIIIVLHLLVVCILIVVLQKLVILIDHAGV